MNLFESTCLLQAVREAYDLTAPQAICVLIAYQHGTVSTLTAREVLSYDARAMSGSSALSMPVRKKLLMEVGKARVKHGSRPSTIYRLVDADAVAAVVERAAGETVTLYQKIEGYETTAQEAIREDK